MMMRKYLILCLLTLTCVVGHAQQAQHVLFKGIPLGGNFDTFRQQMLEKGFALNDRRTDSSGTCSFVGKFAGDFVEVNCIFTPGANTVSKVGVDFKRWTVVLGGGEGGVTRSQQNQRFEQLAASISNNFGKPTQDVRGASGGVERMMLWKVPGGSIHLVLHNIQGKYVTLSLLFSDGGAA